MCYDISKNMNKTHKQGRMHHKNMGIRVCGLLIVLVKFVCCSMKRHLEGSIFNSVSSGKPHIVKRFNGGNGVEKGGCYRHGTDSTLCIPDTSDRLLLFLS